MVIVTNTSHITKGEGHKLIERFDKVGKVEYMDGFLGLEVMLTENTPEYDEVTVSTRWSKKKTSKPGHAAKHSVKLIPTVVELRDTSSPIKSLSTK